MGDWIKPEAVMFGITSWLALMNKKMTRIMVNKIIAGFELPTWCFITSGYIISSPSPPTVNDRLTVNERLPRRTYKHVPTERNALSVSCLFVCTNKQLGLQRQRQRNALRVNILQHRETETKYVTIVYVNKKNKITKDNTTCLLCTIFHMSEVTRLYLYCTKIRYTSNIRSWNSMRIKTLFVAALPSQPDRQTEHNASLFLPTKLNSELSTQLYNVSRTYRTKHKEASTNGGNSAHKVRNRRLITILRCNIYTVTVEIFKIRNSKPVRTYWQIKPSKSRQGPERNPRDTKRTLNDGNNNITLSVISKPEGNYLSNYHKVVISTRDAFAVNIVHILTAISNTPVMNRLYMNQRNKAQRLKEPTRQRKPTSNLKPVTIERTLHKSIDILNYHNVEISTRDVFAVIMVPNLAVVFSTFKHNRLSTSSQNEIKEPRTLKRKVITDTCTKTTSERGQSTDDNYPNYCNVVISTRDEFAVNNSKIDNTAHAFPLFHVLSCQLFNPARRSVTSLKVRISKSFEKHQNVMQKNTLQYHFRELFANYDYPLRQRTTKPFAKIWLLKQLTIVDVTHRNELNAQFKARCINLFLIILTITYDYKLHNTATAKNFQSTMTTVSNIVANKMIETLRTVTSSKIAGMKCMVHVPVRSFYPGSWESKHCRTVITITKTTTISVWQCTKAIILEKMETQRAVDHIPGPSENSDELRALEDFIMSHNDIPTANQRNEEGEDEYEYDPVNDSLKHVGKRKKQAITSNDCSNDEIRTAQDNSRNPIRACQENRQSEGVGEGRPIASTSTGKLYYRRVIKSGLALYSNTSIAGTEPQIVPTQDDGKSKKKVTFSTDNEPLKHTTGVIIAPDQLPPQDMEIDAQLSCSFSDDDTDEDRNNEVTNGTKSGEPKAAEKQIPKYERVDARIQAQKNALWNNRPDEDPRSSALIPIHAPSMERLQLAQLEALKQRAEKAERTQKNGGVVQEIMYGMDKLADINYSIVPVRAEFVTETEILPNPNKKIIAATNDPLTVGPKPPRVKQAREQKVLPFPKGRKQAVKRHLEASRPLKLSDTDSQELLSDESWPTDKDESIVAWQKKKTVRTKTRPEKSKPKSKVIKKPRVIKPKKLTKAAIITLIQQIRDPEPQSLTKSTKPDDCLDRKAVQALVKIQQSRIRQKNYRLRQAQKKLNEKNAARNFTAVTSQQNTMGTDVLAQAISLSNILNPEENMALDELILEEDDAILDSDDNEALDELLKEVTMEAEANRANSKTTKLVHEPIKEKTRDTESESSSEDSSSNSSSSSSSSYGRSGSGSDSSDYSTDSDRDHVWGSSTRLIRNPFARKQSPQPLPAPVNTYPAHQGYFTQQGLKLQKLKLSKLREKAGLSKSSVPIVSLNRQDIRNFLSKYHPAPPQDTNQDSPNTSDNVTHSNTQTQANDPPVTTPGSSMSAKNISKDRSGRPDNAKQDRFTKGRGNAQEEEEKMDQDEATGQGGNGQEERSKGNSKRSREPPRTGKHDNTTTEDSDDELPNAKRSIPSLREKLTQVYQRKTKETRTKLDGERATPSVEFTIDATHAGEKVKTPSVPLLAPTTIAEAPTLSLKDLVPEQDQQDLDGHGQPESFKTDRIVERELDGEESGASNQSDRDYEWEIPDRTTFDAVIGQAIDKFTEDDWDRIDYVTFSSVGWNTGVGLFAFGSDKLVQMSMFRDIVRSIKMGNKRFESYPKRMLLNRYALTIYFNAAFQFSTAPKLLFFFKKLNGFEGDLTIAETRFYPDNHPTRKGCKIVACEADQRFLDELYKYPKDHAFNIRYGGNLYVRGGERIDPDDPNVVKPRRPKLTRTAAKKFIHGAGEDILNEGQKADDEAAKRARDDHMKKHVGYTVLFGVCFNFTLSLFKYAKKYVITTIYSKRTKKHCANDITSYRESESISCNQYSFNILQCKGNDKGERYLWEITAHIYERIKVVGEAKIIYTAMYHFNDMQCINLPMTIMIKQLCIINYEHKLNKNQKICNDSTLKHRIIILLTLIITGSKLIEYNVAKLRKGKMRKYSIYYMDYIYYLIMSLTRIACAAITLITLLTRINVHWIGSHEGTFINTKYVEYIRVSKKHALKRYAHLWGTVARGDYIINYRFMVILTRAVFAVIMPNKIKTRRSLYMVSKIINKLGREKNKIKNGRGLGTKSKIINKLGKRIFYMRMNTDIPYISRGGEEPKNRNDIECWKGKLKGCNGDE